MPPLLNHYFGRPESVTITCPGIVKLTHHKLRQPQDIVSKTTSEYSICGLVPQQPVNVTTPVEGSFPYAQKICEPQDDVGLEYASTRTRMALGAQFFRGMTCRASVRVLGSTAPCGQFAFCVVPVLATVGEWATDL